MTQVKTATVEETGTSSFESASVDALLTPKPAKAMVKGGPLERIGKMVSAKKKNRLMKVYLYALEIFSRRHFDEDISSLTFEELDKWIEYHMCLDKKWKRIMSYIAVGFSVSFLCALFFGSLMFKVITVVLAACFCITTLILNAEFGYFFNGYSKLKKIFGEETNQKIYEALHQGEPV